MSTLTISSLLDTGVSLSVPVVVTGTGTITSSGTAAVTGAGQFGTLTNGGTIAGSVFGISLGQGGFITNLAGGDIAGVSGIDIQGLGQIDNAGLINAAAIGVILQTAALTNELSGAISGGVAAGSGTITNMGTIARATGAIVSFADGGAVFNLGTAAALTGGDVTGVVIGGSAGTVVNQGSISGVWLGAGGTISNSGYLETGSASSAIYIGQGVGDVSNTGTILGVSLVGGGSIGNAAGATITGYVDGVDLTAGGTVSNYGSILGIGARLAAVEPGKSGISLIGAGTINNAAGAVIRGSNAGIQLSGTGTGAATIVNHGTIIGKKGIVDNSTMAATIVDYGLIAGTAGTAIAFEAGNDTLVLKSGAVIQGIVVGGNINQDVTLTVDGTFASGSGGIELQAGGNLLVEGVMAAAQTISFAGTDATLMIGDLNQFRSQITGINSADTIDLTKQSFDPTAYARLTTGNVLEIVGATTVSLQLDPTQNFAGEFFHISSDGLNGTNITESSVPCFLAGTRIATPTGEARVEALRIGDRVLTGAGPAKPVKWIGRRGYAAPLPDDPDVIPVLIRAEALAPGAPAADLYLSPRHAVRVGNMLVPAGALINGVSVLACPQIEAIAYYHVELDRHETIFANGVEAETFIDHDSRRMFDNADEFYRLYPHAWSADFVLCAPRLESGPELEAARRHVALRAGLLLGQPKDAEVIGFLESADRQTITGWAYAPAQPNVPVMLDILNRGALLARAIANIPRPDVRAAGFGHGRCGFSLTLPASLPALRRHEITVRPAGAVLGLTGSPVVIDPAVAHDLIRAGGLKTLIDAAVQGLGSGSEVADLGSSLEAVGRHIRLTAAAPRRPGRPAAARTAGPMALLLDTAWPTVTRDAGSNAIMSHAEAFLRLGYEVAFCATGGAPANEDEAAGLDALRQRGVHCHGQDGAASEDVIRALAPRGLAVVYLHRLAVASAYGGLVRQHAETAKIIYAVADLHHLRLARHAAICGRPDLAAKSRSVKAAELWAMRLADCVVTHSRAEAAYLAREAPRANVHLVPWAVAGPPAAMGRNRRHIAFIGGAGHAPNADALGHLARDIMPLVWARDPSIQCLVAGAGWTGNLFRGFDERMINLGHLSDLAGLLRGVRLTVAPLRFGAGVKGKVLDSMAAGTPCVMTEIAAEGLPLDPHLRAVIGDGPDFARHVLAVYADKKLSRVLAQAGLDMIETSFSEAAVDEALRRALGVAAAAATEPRLLQEA